jgi:DNA-binding NarL/FixJ family response regulator
LRGRDWIGRPSRADASLAGVGLIRSVDPDVALVDPSMAVLDGLGVLSRLRQSGARAKVLLVTAYDGEQARLEGTGLGAHGFLLEDLGRGELDARPGKERRRTIRASPL